MKVSISLPEGDVEFIDSFAKDHGYPSRSAVLHDAVALLRAGGLIAAYDAANREWEADDSPPWDHAVGDGMGR